MSLEQMNIFSNPAKTKPLNSHQNLGATVMLDQRLPLLTGVYIDYS